MQVPILNPVRHINRNMRLIKTVKKLCFRYLLDGNLMLHKWKPRAYLMRHKDVLFDNELFNAEMFQKIQLLS